jgi:hypothetical protein
MPGKERSMSPNEPPRSDELQFEKAELATEDTGPLSCHACQSPLFGVYFEVNGQPSCERCRYEVETEASRGSGPARFARALLGGAAGGLVGAGIYYAVLALTGYEVGLVAIVVGFLVGAGVRWGSRGRGGWAYQGLAVALTYVAIVGTYVPLVVREIAKMDETTVVAAQQPATPQEPAPETPSGELVPAAENSETASPEQMGDPSAGEILAGLALFGLLILALPFLQGFDSILGVLIIGVGLYQAWAMNKRRSLVIEGPFQVGRVPTRPTASAST